MQLKRDPIGGNELGEETWGEIAARQMGGSKTIWGEVAAR
jgi:hypothetical protein